MQTRNILDFSGNIIGTLELPDGTPESVWQEKLNAFKVDPAVIASRRLSASVKERKSFAENMLEEFKVLNMSAGINASQGFELQELMAEYKFNFAGKDRQIDIMNLAVSGDIELACLALIYGPTHDMSLPEHWLSAERKSWLILKMKQYLGWA